MNRVKVFAGFLIILLLSFLAVNSSFLKSSFTTGVENNAKKFNQKVDRSFGRLKIEPDTLDFNFEDSRPNPKTSKFFHNIVKGNFRYAFGRLWIEAKDFTRKVVHLFKILTDKKADKTLFKTEHYRFNFSFEEPIGGCYLRDAQDQILGNMIWVNDQFIDINYIYSVDSLASKVNQILQSKKVLAVFSASFFDQSSQPVGFHVKNGQLINNNFNPFWDGLIIIKQNQFWVSNLNNMELIHNSNANRAFKKSGTDQLPVYHLSLNDEQLSMFQLPLLVFNNTILMNYQTATYRLRDSRLLCKIASENTENDFYLIVNIERPDYLPNMIYSLMESFGEKNITMLYALLLDVGSNNLFNVYQSNNRLNPSFHGLIPLEKANNALVFQLNETNINFQLKLN